MRSILPVLLILSMNAIAQTNTEKYMIVGTYTSGKSEGIYVLKFNTETGESSIVSKTFASNPSFLAISPDQKFVYSVNEDQPGKVSSFSFDKTNGTLTKINEKPSNGDHPCYIAVHPSGKWVVVGNYTGGNLSVLKVDKKGMLSDPVQTIDHVGGSVNIERQEGPHVHATVFSPNGKFLYVPDLGMDKVMIYSFNSKKGKLAHAKTPFQMVEAGAGPRHFEFHPNARYAYLMEELNGSISSYVVEKDASLSLIQNISSHPHDYLGSMGSADIHVSPDGKFLYASNRAESNTIAIFSINPENGKLWPKGFQSTLGSKPRNFNFDPTGKFLLVANQDSDEIVVFERDTETGMLKDSGKRIAIPKPVCIKWID